MKLGKRINILITLLITLIMVFTFFIIIPIQKEHSRITNRKIVDLMHLFITRDNHGIANAIFENRKDAIVQRMDKILTIPDVLSAFVFNSEYTILSSYSENPEISNFKKYFKQSAESGYVSWTESGSLWYLQSVVMYDEIMGYVLINYSLEDTIKKDKKNSVTIIILYLFVTIVLLMSMNIFIMEIIIKPVKTYNSKHGKNCR